MSGPVVAGIAAILLEVNPFLSANQVKSILIETARTDNHTGAIPPHSKKWGWGKVNAYQAVTLALWVVGEQEIELESSFTVFPNPTTSEISINGIAGTVEDVQIIDMNGKSLYASDQSKTINVSELNSGTYFVRLIVDGKVQQVKFMKE